MIPFRAYQRTERPSTYVFIGYIGLSEHTQKIRKEVDSVVTGLPGGRDKGKVLMRSKDRKCP